MLPAIFLSHGAPTLALSSHPAAEFLRGLLQGFANFIAAKGKNEFGGDTAPETNIDMQVMYDLSPVIGAAPKTLKLGLEYQYWKNKFGNDHNGAAGQGAFAKTPMIRAEYHF